jgi:hypothetical protein
MPSKSIETIWREATDGELRVEVITDEHGISVWVPGSCLAIECPKEHLFARHDALVSAAGTLLSMSMACAALAGHPNPELDPE